MKKITLIELSIENFKGIKKSVIRFDGGNMNIYGRNATGKSTMYDAWTWLLFGKNAAGQADFGIKPLDENGNVKYPGAYITVSAIIDIDGEELNLKRVNSERWETQRGSSEKEFKGNTTEYYIDGVPCQKYRYDARVEQIIDENLFKLLTGVYVFNNQKWQDRRTALFGMINTMSDRDLMSGETKFLALLDAVGKHELDDYRKIITSSRKSYNGEKSEIPARIDECGLLIANIKSIDFTAMKTERETLIAELETAKSKSESVADGTIINQIKNEIDALKNELTALENSNALHRERQANSNRNGENELKLKNLRDKRVLLEKMLLNDTQLLTKAETSFNANNSELDKLRKDYTEAGKIKPDIKTDCPTCGRRFDQESLNVAMEEHNKKVDIELADILSKVDKAKNLIATANKDISECKENIESAKKGISEIDKEIISIKSNITVVDITDMPGYDERTAEIYNSISELQKKRSVIIANNETVNAGYSAEISVLASKIKTIDGEINKESLLESYESRADELRQKNRDLGAKIEEIDKYLYLLDEFTKYKVSFVEDTINSLFRFTKFKLYDVQINGAVADWCEATYNGVPYSDLNSGMRINIGLDIINTLSKHYGVCVPLFIDNAESVNSILDIDTQVIKLVVTESDKEMRCEVNAVDSETENKISSTAA